jgi:NAD(P)-dependent dehydrogenase (short-subunit alcohol dehydrogenase family)
MAFNLLPGKIVAVTGCSTGIGRAIAIGELFEDSKAAAVGEG